MTQSKRQNLDFNLIRSGQFSVKELGVLAYINSFSEHCSPPSLSVMAKNLQTSERTLRRRINSLVLKGILKKTYRAFKRVRLQIVSLVEQKALHGPGMLKKAFRNIVKSRKKRYDRSNGARYDRSTLSEPIENKKLENKTKQNGLNFNLKALEQPILKSREQQLSEFWAHHGSLKPNLA